MASKIIAALATLFANLAAGVVVLFTLLVAMNGYSGSDAEWGLGAFMILAVVIVILMTAASVILVHVLLKRKFSAVVSAMIAILVFAITGIVFEIIAGLVGIGIAEYVRVDY